MRIAITTKYISATNTRGSKIKAYSIHKSLSIPYPQELDSFDAHRNAADTLAETLKYTKNIAWALLPGKEGYVFIYE